MRELFRKDGKRFFLIFMAAVITAVNIKTFVRTGGLIPGGLNGASLLIQRICVQVFGTEPPFSVLNLSLNVIPIYIGFRYIGKRFTIYSLLMIVLTSIFTDLIPPFVMTNDMVLISIFGGIINGFAVALCLRGGTTSGGTDIVAVYMSERQGIDAWNMILGANVVLLAVAGYLFGWEPAFYSILFQYASTQVVHVMNLRYKKHTLFIVTDYPDKVYEVINENTHHGATILTGTGCHYHSPHSVLYSVVSSAEVKQVVTAVKRADPQAFINTLKTDQIGGRFYLPPNE